MKEKVTCITKDGVAIAADFYRVFGAHKGVILIHMMPNDRTSWIPFAKKLQQNGFQVLAFDLRGHGESQGGPLGYKNFSDAKHQASYYDIEAAEKFLRKKGVTRINCAGASIGANLALWYCSRHAEVVSAILLSAGIDYRGIKTEPCMQNIKEGQAIYFVGSLEDERSSGVSAAEVAKRLFALCRGKKELREFDGAGHGTTMLERNPDFMDVLAAWVVDQNRDL